MALSAARSHPVLGGLAALGLLATAVLVLRGISLIVAWEEHAPVEGWMTPRYIALAYGLPIRDLAVILDVPAAAVPAEPLSRIAQATDRDPGTLVAEVEAAVQARRGAEE